MGPSRNDNSLGQNREVISFTFLIVAIDLHAEHDLLILDPIFQCGFLLIHKVNTH